MVIYIFFIAAGIIGIAIGAAIMRGNAPLVEWAVRRKGVEKEDIPSFSKFYGLSSAITGTAVIIFGGSRIAQMLPERSSLNQIAEFAAVIGILAGIGLNLFTMVKYTNGKGSDDYL